MRRNQDDFNEIWQQLTRGGKTLATVPGRPPSLIPIYAGTFSPSNDSGSSGSGPARDDYATKQRAFVGGFCEESNSCASHEAMQCPRALRYPICSLDECIT